MQDVERRAGVLGADRVHHGVDIALEVAAGLLAERLQPDHPHAGDGRGRTAAVHGGVAAAVELADHGHVVPAAHQLA